MTEDNKKEQQLHARLKNLTDSRLAFLEESIKLKKDAPEDDDGQADLVRRSLPSSSEMTVIMERMRQEEQHLLEIRESAAHRLFILTACFVGGICAVSCAARHPLSLSFKGTRCP